VSPGIGPSRPALRPTAACRLRGGSGRL
jgi:hypothetical protein